MKKNSNKNQRTKKQQRLLFIGLAIGSIVAGGIVFIAINGTPVKRSVQQHIAPSDDPSTDIWRKYQELMAHLVVTNVCPGITPVHIFREVDNQKFLHATGGQLAGDGNILTCGHAFWEINGEHKVPWKFYYRILQPPEKEFHSINRLVVIEKMETNTVNASKDVIACIPGASKLIDPLAAPSEAIISEKITFDYFFAYKDEQIVRSTVTGESVRLLGQTRLSNGPDYFVLDYSCFQSQSGTPFANTNNSKLYIISRSLKLTPEIRKVFGLSKDHKGVSLCSSVNLR
ncbi:MAG TPA: hypothetical protein VK675_04115 [Candidatus Paceibacterota bacterium]|nr:hypothetical protein [Candidatus Paceibacterota bacterium]